MKLKLFVLFFLGVIKGLNTVEFETVMIDLENLEKYIRLYIQEKNSQYNLTHLITCYIREGAYTEVEWTIAGGSIPEDLSQYIIDKDLLELIFAKHTEILNYQIMKNSILFIFLQL